MNFIHRQVSQLFISQFKLAFHTSPEEKHETQEVLCSILYLLKLND